jgi:agmatine/peptidylarginine deiminase
MTTFTSEDRVNSEPILNSCRDTGMATYTYFWTIKQKVISPYFNSESDATDWMELKKYQAESQAIWSDSCTTPRKNR